MTADAEAVVRTRGLTKRFGRFVAVDHVDLDVDGGDRYGFLGPNGSGKTTTLRMVLGLVFATSGEIELLGRRVPKHLADVLPDVGALVEGPAAYGHLSARANLLLLDAAGPRSRTRGRRARVDEVLDQVGLGGVGRRPVRAFSLGMRQRLGIAGVLIRRPRLLVLDEPTNGLDPQGIREVRDLLLDLNRSGTTLLVSSHQLLEVEQLCDRVGVVDRGRLVLQERLDAVRAPTGRVVVRTPDAARAHALLDGRVAMADGERLLVAGLPVEEVVRRLAADGLRVREAVEERRSLEDVVLAVTSHGSDRVARDITPSRPDAAPSPRPDAAPVSRGDQALVADPDEERP